MGAGEDAEDYDGKSYQGKQNFDNNDEGGVFFVKVCVGAVI